MILCYKCKKNIKLKLRHFTKILNHFSQKWLTRVKYQIEFKKCVND